MHWHLHSMAWLPPLAMLFFVSTVSAISNFSFNYDPLGNNVQLFMLQNVTFSESSIKLNENGEGTAKIYYRNPFRFKNSTTVASFTTSFTFLINTTKEYPSDGMTFFIQADPTPIADKGYLGQNGSEDNPFLAVEFDTFQDSPYDPPGQHVGIDLNNMSSVAYHRANITNKQLKACIDYYAPTQMLALSLANDTVQCPKEPIISAQVDLPSFFKNNDSLYVGLSATTCKNAEETHIVYSWSFDISEISDGSISNLASPGPYYLASPGPYPYSGPSYYSYDYSPVSVSSNDVKWIVSLAVPSVAVVIGIMWLVWWKKTTKNTSLPEVFDESELLKMRLSKFSYVDMSNATKGFSQKELLGKGGFGSVYKGILPNGTTAAVKVMSAEGYHQFMAELLVIGRLKHKNLVGLKGWCYEKDKLILVYDYMPNGSLDQHLFSPNQGKLLTWRQRYEIIKGAAEGLAFLHGGWEQRIAHRDIKAANVLLDSNYVAKLGDFGLSKLMENNITQQTMTHAGTRGYIAPELAYIGRASEKSDIYSFGILLLEVVCGRSVLVVQPETQDYDFLWEQVWGAQLLDALLTVVDPRLELEYDRDEEQMKLLLCLGLLCSHPDAGQRPSMRRCCQILNAEAILPSLPNSKPTMHFGFSRPISSLDSTCDFLPQATASSSKSLPFLN